MIDPLQEELIPLCEAVAIFPKRRNGRKPHVSTLYRYSRHGYRGAYLETVRAAGTVCTSREAVARFIYEMTVADARSPLASAPQSSPRGDDKQRGEDLDALLKHEGLL